MYEDKRGTNFSLGGALFKLVLVFLIFFALFIVFYALKKLSTTNINPNREYATNLKDMKEGAFEYFTEAKLPEKIGESKTLTLGEMVDQKLIYDFSENGKACSLSDSYVKATKTSDENYALKVLLDCGKVEDYLVTTIEKKEKCTVDCKEVVEEVLKKTTNVNKTESSTNTTNTTKPQTGAVGKTEAKVTYTKNLYHTVITLPCVGCEKPKPAPTPTPDPKPEVKPEEKVKWYKHEKTIRDLYYDYCKMETDTYHTVSWIKSDANNGKTYTYKLELLNSKNFINNTVSISSHNYFTSALTDYNTYLNNRLINIEMVDNISESSVWDISASVMRAHALKSGNFTYNLSAPYIEKNIYYIDVRVNYLHSSGVTPYYFKKVNQNIYFVPIKFNLKYGNKNACTEDLDSNSKKYTTHIKINPVYKNSTTYYWSTNIKESGYTYTGISEYR